MKTTPFPSADQIKARLNGLSAAKLQQLSTDSKVPYTTLNKMRRGETHNPRIETVRAFWPHLPAEDKATA